MEIHSVPVDLDRGPLVHNTGPVSETFSHRTVRVIVVAMKGASEKIL